MNHFFLSADGPESATWHADFHVGKMAMEGAQVLSAAHPPGAAPYLRTHTNHPCAVWARASKANYSTLAGRCLDLVAEAKYRGRGYSSSVESALIWLSASVPSGVPDAGPTPPHQGVPRTHAGSDVVRAYQAYYLADKQGYWTKSRTSFGFRVRWVPASWSRRDPPPWWSWAPLPDAPTEIQATRLGITRLPGDVRVEIVRPCASTLQPLRMSQWKPSEA